MKQKTAIRQLIEYCEEQSKLNNIVHSGLIMALTKARQLEAVNKQQIIDAYLYGFTDSDKRVYPDVKKYFKETYE